MGQEIYERSPVRVLASHLEGGLGRGKVGFIAAEPGVGKSALLVHLALDTLLREENVLHVSMTDSVDHVRQFYDQIVRAASRASRVQDQASALVTAERNRMIHSYLNRVFSREHLEQNLEMLRQVAEFQPAVVVFDGLDAESVKEHLPAIAAFARSHDVPVWFTMRASADASDALLWEHVSFGLELEPDGPSVKIRLRGDSGSSTVLPVNLDPKTMLVLGDEVEVSGVDDVPPSPRAADCTVYSGGANGAEAAFGEVSERWGVQEVNFTFDGHKQIRSRGRYLLSARELAAGDVSLVYVSRRLNRTYSEGSLIRRVLQTLWHMVSRSQQVFVVGQIQEDGTVIGGTGWSVELARMWNKSLWVFDQEKAAWYRWDGHDWASGVPVIESVHFCGTGTRYLSEAGRRAIDDLFERSFGRQA